MKRFTAMILAVLIILTVAASAMGEENKIWQKGDTGEKVTWIQQRLKDLEYLNREPTGVFDEETEEALRDFQRDNGLLRTGMADEVTMRALETATETVSDRQRYVCNEAEYEESAAYDGSMMMTAAYAPTPAKGMAAETDWNTDEYTHFESNRFLSTQTSPLSTFAADVDTSSYAHFRRLVLNGEHVPADAIRIEEMLNYFHYNYQAPKGDEPFGVTVEIGNCPWNDKTKLMLIGLQAKEVTKTDRPGHNLVFLIDTSGSMYGADRLDLVKRAFLMLLDEMEPTDTVSIVAYASQERVVLEGVPVGGSGKVTIMEALSELEAGGATNGSAGIARAYEIASKYYVEGGVNRILLATDGDLNVGTTSEGELAEMVTEKKKAGISLTCLGVGMGNYKDNKMEALADYGDGNCWYLDTIHEARKALISEAGGTFITVAKDVKIQVDFNPSKVKGYRLIGYEDRVMAAEDFANDEKDGGEIGSGHRMTALYEIVPVDSDFDFGEAESRYQKNNTVDNNSADWLTVAIRAKEPEGTESKLYEYPVGLEQFTETLSDNMRFAAAVVEAGMLIRNSEWKGTATWDSALELVRSCGNVTGDAYKEEFLYLLTLLQRGN